MRPCWYLLEHYTSDEVDHQVGMLPEKLVQGGVIDMMRIQIEVFYKSAKRGASCAGAQPQLSEQVVLEESPGS